MIGSKYIKLTGRKFHDELLFPIERIGVMWNVKEDRNDMEDAYTVLVCDGTEYKVLETKEEILERIGGIAI